MWIYIVEFIKAHISQLALNIFVNIYTVSYLKTAENKLACSMLFDMLQANVHLLVPMYTCTWCTQCYKHLLNIVGV